MTYGRGGPPLWPLMWLHICISSAASSLKHTMRKLFWCLGIRWDVLVSLSVGFSPLKTHKETFRGLHVGPV